MIPAYILCSCVLASYSNHATYERRLNTCIEVAESAEEHRVPVELALAVAYHESRFSNVTSHAGAMGPMQIIPKWHCPRGRREGCSLIDDGVKTLRRYLRKYKRKKRALAHWNGGNHPGRLARGFARKVLKTYRRLVYFCRKSIDSDCDC
jgi:soluble lytic murein transglycosylase-like protein